MTCLLACRRAFLAVLYVGLCRFVEGLVSPSWQLNQNQNQQVPRRETPHREFKPPFPDGLCGGTIVTLPPEETYALDKDLAGNEWLLPSRPIPVWLPPGYGQSGYRHPVIYCHDGQNSMEDSSSWTGYSWRLAGALTRLYDHEKIRALPIVVLLPAADDDLLGVRRRHLEYGELILPFGRAHADFVARTLKPVVDTQFLTLTRAHDTFAIGSSLGGQASTHLLWRHGDRFGGAGCLSPAFGPSLLRELSNPDIASQKLKGKRIYLDMGGDLDDTKVALLDVFDHITDRHWWNPGFFWLDTQLQNSLQRFWDALDEAQIDYACRQFAGGRHNERAWSQRIHLPLIHLLGK